MMYARARVAFLVVALSVLGGCSDNSEPAGGSSGGSGGTGTSDAASDTSLPDAADTGTDTEADVASDASPDTSFDTGVDAVAEAGTDAVADAPADVEPDTTPGGDLITEEFTNLAIELIVGSSITVSFDLPDPSAEVELLVVRELSGYTEVQDGDTGGAVMYVANAPFNDAEAGWETGTLSAGPYDLFCSNNGGSAQADNGYVAVKVLRRPTYAPAVATFAKVALEYGSLVDPGSAIPVPFVVEAGHRYVIRGVRGLNTFFLVAADQLPLIQAGQPFQADYIWDETSYEVAPQATELNLTPGDYALLFANVSGDGLVHGSVARIEAWAEQ